jgi:hydrogenase nickel incorporation protein HypA/HybF
MVLCYNHFHRVLIKCKGELWRERSVMHELSITQSIVDIVVGEAANRRIRAVNLVIGELSSVMEESIRFCFGIVSKDTSAEGAQLSVRKVPLVMRCTYCSFEFGRDSEGICPACSKSGGEMIRGREFFIESIEVED